MLSTIYIPRVASGLSEVLTYHVYLEIFLIFVILYVLRKKSYSENGKIKYSLEEQDKIIRDWMPEPLVGKFVSPKIPRVISGKVGKFVDIESYRCLNLASYNFLGFVQNENIENDAVSAVGKYGVGSCGPRGFYGTVDIHLTLEEKLANFMNQEEAVVYSYGFSTVASAIPAYSKKGDVVFVDENVNFAIQMGLRASRSNIKYFKHNNPEHLESLLKIQEAEDKKNPKKAAKTRRFLIVEGIYQNSGDICKLPELLDLRKKYKLRAFVDESVSFGTLGATGRGVTEHFNIPVTEVDLIMGSLELAIGSIGGFCVGSTFIIEHQRLSGLGYCFSASLPPLLSAAAISALNEMDSKPEIIQNLQKMCLYFSEAFETSPVSQHFTLQHDPLSPVKHLYVHPNKCLEKIDEVSFLEKVVNICMTKGIALTTASYLEEDRFTKKSSIRITINTELTGDDIDHALSVIETAVVTAR